MSLCKVQGMRSDERILSISRIALKIKFGLVIFSIRMRVVFWKIEGEPALFGDDVDEVEGNGVEPCVVGFEEL